MLPRRKSDKESKKSDFYQTLFQCTINQTKNGPELAIFRLKSDQGDIPLLRGSTWGNGGHKLQDKGIRVMA